MQRRLSLTIRSEPGGGKSRLIKIILDHLKAEHREYHIVSETHSQRMEVLCINVEDMNEGGLNAKNQSQRDHN